MHKQCGASIDRCANATRSIYRNRGTQSLERRIDGLERGQIKSDQKVDQLADGLATCLTALGEKKVQNGK